MTEDDRTGYSSTAEADRVASVPATRAAAPSARGAASSAAGPRRRRDPLAARVPDQRAAAFLALFSFVFGAVLAFVPKLSGLQHEIQVKFSSHGNGAN